MRIKMKFVEKDINSNDVEKSSDVCLREHVVSATVNLLQAQLLMRRLVRDQQNCNPTLLLRARLNGIKPVLVECLRLCQLLQCDPTLASSAAEDDEEHIGSIAARYFASAEGQL